MEKCAACGLTIEMGQPSYYRRSPNDDIGQTYHTKCGDPFGLAAKDAEIEKLQREVHELKRTRSEAEAAAKVQGYRDGVRELRQQFRALLIDG